MGKSTELTDNAFTEYVPLSATSKTGCFRSKHGWQQIQSIRALCPDGEVRTCRVAQAPDTAFTIRGNVTIWGISLSGYIDVGADGEYHFHPSKHSRNFERYTGLVAARASAPPAPTTPRKAPAPRRSARPVHLRRGGRTGCGRLASQIAVDFVTDDPFIVNCGPCRSSLAYSLACEERGQKERKHG